MKQRSDTSLAYFYCSFDNESTQQSINILGSIVGQLASQDHSLLAKVRPIYEEHTQQAHRSPIEQLKLESLLDEHASSKTGDVYIFIDALNETSSALDVLRTLVEVMIRCKNIRLFVTTTSHIDQSILSRVPTTTIELQPDTLNDDIALFVTSGLSTNKTMQTLDPALKADIQDTLIKNANGS